MNLETRIKKLEEVMEQVENIPVLYINLKRVCPSEKDMKLPEQRKDWITVKKQLAKKTQPGMPKVIIVDPAKEIEIRKTIMSKQNEPKKLTGNADYGPVSKS